MNVPTLRTPEELLRLGQELRVEDEGSRARRVALKLLRLRAGETPEAAGVTREDTVDALREILNEVPGDVLVAAQSGDGRALAELHAAGMRRLTEMGLGRTPCAAPAPEPESVELGAVPLVSCIMPTANRRPFVPRALAQFLEQDYPNRELIVVDDGDDDISDLVPTDERITLIRLPRRHRIGEKRNIACAAARGPLICHWDDDDWMAPRRLTYQVGELLRSGADLCGLQELYYHYTDVGEACKVRAFRLEAGGTCLYKRALWELYPFRDVIFKCEDGDFLDNLRGNLWFKELALSDPSFYVVTGHPGNTCCYPFPREIHQAPLTPDDKKFLSALTAPKRFAQVRRHALERGLPDPATQSLEDFRKRAGLPAPSAKEVEDYNRERAALAGA